MRPSFERGVWAWIDVAVAADPVRGRAIAAGDRGAGQVRRGGGGARGAIAPTTRFR